MSISNPSLDSEHAITETIGLHWALFLAQGIIMSSFMVAVVARKLVRMVEQAAR